jgi:hypothetical protein
MSMAKSRRDEEFARVNAERARRGARRKGDPVVVDYGKCWDRVERILHDLYGDETPQIPSETGQ